MLKYTVEVPDYTKEVPYYTKDMLKPPKTSAAQQMLNFS